MSFLKDQAHIAQTVEHFLGKEEVTGSSPVMGSRACIDNNVQNTTIDIGGNRRKCRKKNLNVTNHM